jgi:hypothetical protein
MDQALADTITQPDTKLCLMRGLVPVTLIYRTGQAWSIDNIIATLKSRDIWARGGGEKVAEEEDAVDAANEASIRQHTRDDMWDRSGLAYQLYKRRTGQRVSSPGMGSERHVPTARSSSSTTDAGLVLASR